MITVAMLRSLIPRSPLTLMAIALAVPVLYGALAVDPVPASEEKQGCGRTEWVVHQAGQCLLYPVQRWERLGDIAGVRLQTCREQLATLNNLGFYRDEAFNAAQWADTRKSSVGQYWREVVGRDFCGDATRRASQSRADASVH